MIATLTLIVIMLSHDRTVQSKGEEIFCNTHDSLTVCILHEEAIHAKMCDSFGALPSELFDLDIKRRQLKDLYDRA